MEPPTERRVDGIVVDGASLMENWRCEACTSISQRYESM